MSKKTTAPPILDSDFELQNKDKSKAEKSLKIGKNIENERLKSGEWHYISCLVGGVKTRKLVKK